MSFSRPLACTPRNAHRAFGVSIQAHRADAAPLLLCYLSLLIYFLPGASLPLRCPSFSLGVLLTEKTLKQTKQGPCLPSRKHFTDVLGSERARIKTDTQSCPRPGKPPLPGDLAAPQPPCPQHSPWQPRLCGCGRGLGHPAHPIGQLCLPAPAWVTE